MSVLLEVKDLRVFYRRVEGLHRASLQVRAGRHRHGDRAQRRGQDHAARRADGPARLPGRGALPGRLARRRAGRGARAARPVPGARAARALRRDAGGGQPGARRLPALPQPAPARAGPRGGVRALSAPEGAARPARRHALRRRAPDAGARPRPDGAPEAPDARRAEPRPRAAGGARGVPRHRASCAPRACRSCWWSRTRAPRCRSPTTATCWRPAKWCSKARRASSPPIRGSSRPISASPRRPRRHDPRNRGAHAGRRGCGPAGCRGARLRRSAPHLPRVLRRRKRLCCRSEWRARRHGARQLDRGLRRHVRRARLRRAARAAQSAVYEARNRRDRCGRFSVACRRRPISPQNPPGTGVAPSPKAWRCCNTPAAPPASRKA